MINFNYSVIHKRLLIAPGIIILLFLLSFLAVCKTNAQSSPLYSKHYIYEQFINPAITGRDISPVLNLSHKQYFFGVKGSPYSTCLGGSFRLGIFDFYTPQKMLNRTGFFSKGRMGFGGLLLQEKDGPLNTYFAELSYAYFLPLKRQNSELSFGLSGQIFNYHINKNILVPLDPGDQQILNYENNKLTPDAGCGIYYHDLQFYAGVSINDLFLSNRTLSGNRVMPNKRDYFFLTGHKFFLKRFEMEPSLYLALIDDKPVYYFSQLKFYYMNYNWIAVGYRSAGSLLFSLGVHLHRFYVAYAYEQSISGMSSYFSGSHEIMFGMNIGLFEPLGLRKTNKRR
jgi:type IX secretion system PorP/SprF family membrane protein